MEEIRRNYTRVTTPLGLYNNFDRIPADVLRHACERGTRTHKYCELYARGDYFPALAEGDEVFGYLKSFSEWFDSMVDTLISTEQRFYDDSLMLTGAVDLISVLKGDIYPTIIDIKTPASKASSWGLQIAAYKYLYNTQEDTERMAERRIALMLDKEGGRAKVVEYTNHEKDLDLYFSAFELWRHFCG